MKQLAGFVSLWLILWVLAIAAVIPFFALLAGLLVGLSLLADEPVNKFGGLLWFLLLLCSIWEYVWWCVAKVMWLDYTWDSFWWYNWFN
jgi:hypothetical protein